MWNITGHQSQALFANAFKVPQFWVVAFCLTKPFPWLKPTGHRLIRIRGFAAQIAENVVGFQCIAAYLKLYYALFHVMWLKQCHKPSIFWWFLPAVKMVMTGGWCKWHCFNPIQSKHVPNLPISSLLPALLDDDLSTSWQVGMGQVTSETSSYRHEKLDWGNQPPERHLNWVKLVNSQKNSGKSWKITIFYK